jgi:hypothetical protein
VRPAGVAEPRCLVCGPPPPALARLGSPPPSRDMRPAGRRARLFGEKPACSSGFPASPPSCGWPTTFTRRQILGSLGLVDQARAHRRAISVQFHRDRAGMGAEVVIPASVMSGPGLGRHDDGALRYAGCRALPGSRTQLRDSSPEHPPSSGRAPQRTWDEQSPGYPAPEYEHDPRSRTPRTPGSPASTTIFPAPPATVTAINPRP